jgi:hypothetical protein
MYRVELATRDGDRLQYAVCGTSRLYPSPEAALAEVLPQAQDYARLVHHGLWLRVCDDEQRPVFGTLVP